MTMEGIVIRIDGSHVEDRGVQSADDAELRKRNLGTTEVHS